MIQTQIQMPRIDNRSEYFNLILGDFLKTNKISKNLIHVFIQHLQKVGNNLQKSINKKIHCERGLPIQNRTQSKFHFSTILGKLDVGHHNIDTIQLNSSRNSEKFDTKV